MACKYLVNGEWYSEEDFKQILNNGLLDNIVSASETPLEGFPVDEKKLYKTVTLDKSRSTIPILKLQEILIDEVRSRKGYPEGMLSALELNEDRTTFKLPLWSSPYATKFESILTSLVSKKVIKQKFKGGSYVLGTQEGFLTVDNLEEEFDNIIKQFNTKGSLSDIIFTEDFDFKKGLKPMRFEGGVLKPAQILIPCKFKDDKGNIINPRDFLIEKDGKMVLDHTAIPKDLLKMFGFRIPTQNQNSMSMIEIVGFLPQVMGDLVIAPRDFTVQMGSDFDVDKLYSYMKEYFYKDGKFFTNFMSDESKILKAKVAVLAEIDKISDELFDTKEDYNKLKELLEDTQDDSFENNLNSLINSLKYSKVKLSDKLKEQTYLLKVLDNSYEASLRNEILDIHFSIMSNPNPEVVKAIIKPDGFGKFEDIATELENLKEEEEISVLSETYQRNQYISGSAGKVGVGSFSLDSTFNASVQGKGLVLQNLPADYEVDESTTAEDIIEANNPIVTFGEYVSKGDLSDKYTLASRKIIDKAKGRKLTKKEQAMITLKSDIIQALQSVSVDNANAAIMSKIGIGNNNFDVVRAMIQLGFEEYDIVGLVNQPIIKEYLKQIEKRSASILEYTPGLKDAVVNELYEKYDPSGTLANFENKSKLENISGTELMDIIKSKEKPKRIAKEQASLVSDFNLQQLLLLDKFLKLSDIGVTIKTLQSTINSYSKGVPKNLIENSLKVQQINAIGTKGVFNAEKLLGEFDESGNLINPTTIQGFASYYGVMGADKMYESYFPYTSELVTFLHKELLLHTGKQEKSIAAQADLEADLMDNLRAYLFSDSRSELFSNTIEKERFRLFRDTKTNKSLATVLTEFKNNPKNTWFHTNPFLNNLDLKVEKNGNLSRVFREASVGDNFDETNTYLGFLNLFNSTTNLGVINGIEYSPFKLAQDLITYAYLEGGQQGAKQFLKYIPPSYLKLLDLGDFLNNMSLTIDEVGGTANDNYGNPDYFQPSRFIRQYFQNNSNNAISFSLDYIEGKVNDSAPPLSFKLSEAGRRALKTEVSIKGTPITTMTKFISSRAFKTKEPVLYEYDSATKTYNRIPVVSDSYNFLSYNADKELSLPIQEGRFTGKTVPKVEDNYTNEVPSLTQPSNPTQVLVNTKPLNSVGGLIINAQLEGEAQLKDLLIQITNKNYVSDSYKLLAEKFSKLNYNLEGNKEPFKVVFIDDNKKTKGSYNPESNTLTINKHFNQTNEDLVETIIHETAHVFTSKFIKLYNNPATRSSLTQEQQEIIQNLSTLQSRYKEHLKATNSTKDLYAFRDAYLNYKYRNNPVKLEALLKQDIEGLEGMSRDSILPIDVFNKEGQSKFYGAIKLEEFVTMALTDPGFQKHLNSIKDKGNSKTFFENILDLLTSILETLGLNINKDSVLATAIKDSLQLIESSQKQQSKNKFKVVGNEIIYVEDGSTAEEFDTHEEALANLDSWNNFKQTSPQVVNDEVKETPTSANTKYELFPGVFANQGQTEALDKLNEFLQSDKKTFLLQGKGGTGKTTIIKKALENNKSNSLLIIAPTHKAKDVIEEQVKDITQNLRTLASALAIKLDENTGKFEPDVYARKMGNVPISKASLIVIDESSMVSDKLLEEIKVLMPIGAKIIFMGDKAQLPPVGQESDSKVFDISNGYELTEKMRQAKTSPIINIGTKVAANVESEVRVANPITSEDRVDKYDEVSKSSITWESSENEALNQFVEDIQQANGNVNYAKVITFNNQSHNSSQSVKNLNKKIRNKLFGERASTEEYIVGEIVTAYDSFIADTGRDKDETLFNNSEDLIVTTSSFKPKQKFTITVSSQKDGTRKIDVEFDINYLELKNRKGKDIDYIVPVIAESSKNDYEQTLQKLFRTDRQLGYALSKKFANIQHGYAITSHKAQGSTYTNVYVMEDNIMGSSNGGSTKAKNQSLYVAVSRPTTKLVMVSSKNDKEAQTNTPSSQDLNEQWSFSSKDLDGDTLSINDLFDLNDSFNKIDEILPSNLENRKDYSSFVEKYNNYKKICN